MRRLAVQLSPKLEMLIKPFDECRARPRRRLRCRSWQEWMTDREGNNRVVM
jgi:hypothetical protein